MHDPRALWGMALTYATGIRGACHCADDNLYAEMGLFTHKEQGIGRAWPFRPKGKAAQTVGSQTLSILSNSLVTCEYVETAAFNKIQDTVDLVNAATGLGYDLKSMIDTAHRIWYIKRAFANLCGATRDDDQVPKRIIEPHAEGPVSSLNMALYPTYITMYPITWFFTNQKIMKLAEPRDKPDAAGAAFVPGFKEVKDIHGLYEKLMGITAGMANAFLFPNINKILRALRFFPGHAGHRPGRPRCREAHRPLPEDAGGVLPAPRHRPAGPPQPQAPGVPGDAGYRRRPARLVEPGSPGCEPRETTQRKNECRGVNPGRQRDGRTE